MIGYKVLQVFNSFTSQLLTAFKKGKSINKIYDLRHKVGRILAAKFAIVVQISCPLFPLHDKTSDDLIEITLSGSRHGDRQCLKNVKIMQAKHQYTTHTQSNVVIYIPCVVFDDFCCFLVLLLNLCAVAEEFNVTRFEQDPETSMFFTSCKVVQYTSCFFFNIIISDTAVIYMHMSYLAKKGKN